jgi:flagellar FliL protein
MSDTPAPAPASSEESGAQSKSKSKLPLIAGLAVLLLAGGGGGYWFFVVRAKAAAAKSTEEGGKDKAEKKKKADDEEHASADEEESSDEPAADEESNAETAHSAGKKKKEFKFTPPDDKEVKHVIELQPFIVNLADREGNYYLRMTLSIGVGESREEKADPLFTTRVRNAILAVLTTRTSEDVLTPEGKARLRRELLKAVRRAVEEPKIHAIYITDLIVQL